MFGLLLIDLPEKLLDVISEIEPVNPPKNYGKVYREFTANVLLLIQTFGKHTKLLFLVKVIGLLAKKPDKLIISKDSIILCVKEFHVCYEKASLFPKICKTTLGLFGTSYMTTMPS